MHITVKNQEKLKLKISIKSKKLSNYQTFLHFLENCMHITVKNQEKLKLKISIKSKKLSNYQTFLHFLVNNLCKGRVIHDIISMIELFAKIVRVFQPLSGFTKMLVMVIFSPSLLFLCSKNCVCLSGSSMHWITKCIFYTGTKFLVAINIVKSKYS